MWFIYGFRYDSFDLEVYDNSKVIDYFEKWMHRAKEWTHCFREGVQHHTNNMVESAFR